MKIKDRKNSYTHQKTIKEGLIIFKRPRSPYWYMRIWSPSEMKSYIRSTKETNRLDAIEVAIEISNKLTANKKVISVPKDATFKYFAELLMEQQKLETKKSKSFAYDDEKKILRPKYGLIAYFGRMDIKEITTFDFRKYLNFITKDRDTELSKSSLNKYLSIISKIFNLAYEKGGIDRVPIIPKIGISDNPRPSFSEKEYKLFLKTTRMIIKEEVEVRGVPLTQEMYLFIVFMTHSFLRPIQTEVFALKHRDVEVVRDPKHLRLRINGKTGWRYSHTMQLAVDFYDKLLEFNAPHTKEDDYVFQPSYRNRTSAYRNMQRQLNFILEKCNLKTTKEGVPRTAYALRHYALQTRLLKSKGKVNIYQLAKNSGTSVNQLERFYLKDLQMDKDAIKNLQSY